MRTKTYYEFNKRAIDALSQALGVNTAYACLMHQRNIKTIEEAKHYLNPTKEHLKDFSLLKNIIKRQIAWSITYNQTTALCYMEIMTSTGHRLLHCCIKP